MRSLRKVLRDETGASLSIALLLFLVCTVISAVVLVAGTTASGRVAELAKMDQKYYSVNSAVELFADQLKEESEDSNKCLTVKESLTFTVDESAATYKVTGDLIDIENEPAEDTLSSMLGKYLAFGTTKEPILPADGMQDMSESMSEDGWFTKRIEWEFSPIRSNTASTSATPLTLTIDPADASVENATVTVAFTNDGSANLTFQNEHAEGEVAYIVSATLVPKPEISTEPGSDGTTETKSVTMKWELADVTSERTV